MLLLKSNIKKNGFALWEVVVCFACMSFLIGAVIYSFNAFSGYMMRADFYILKSIIIHAHYKALATGIKQEIVFDSTKNGYDYEGMFTRLSSGNIFGIVPAVSGPPANPKILLTKPITFDKNTIVCYPSGGVSAGALYLLDTRRNLLYACTISVAHSFVVKLYRYERYEWIVIA